MVCFLKTFFILGSFLSSNFPPTFPLFFRRKTGKAEKQEKQETFPKFGNLTEGKIFGRLHIAILEAKIEKYGIQKIARKKYLEIYTKSSSIRTALSPQERVDINRPIDY